MDKSLKILYISHYFPPEVNAPAVRVSEMAQRWEQQGADVTVLTCFPNHPTGIIPKEYKGLWHSREMQGLVKVIRTYVFAAPNKGFLKRIINYLSFMLSSIFIGTWMAGKPDIVIATSPQFFVALSGYVISRLKGSKFVFEIRDLWPEEIIAVGALKNRLAIRALEAIEMFLYRKADIIVAVAEGTIQTLKKRGVSESKMVLIPNGVDIDFFGAGSGGQKVRGELGLGDNFIVGYIGTHGMAHRLDTVLAAAALLSGKRDILFMFVGEGAEKAHLVELASSMGLKNVIFCAQVSRARIAGFYAACDICLVPLRKADLFTKNIPSKIYEIMASVRPMIICADGESRRLVENAGAGLAARPEDPQDLAAKIEYLYDRSDICHKMGQCGYSFALANCSRNRLAEEYLDTLAHIVNCDSGLKRAKQSPITSENINSMKQEQKSFAETGK
jgi:glycosyltransferase involved in cell wall biosynthesis